MKRACSSAASILIFFHLLLLLVTRISIVEAQSCEDQSCKPSGKIKVKNTLPEECNYRDCCQPGKLYHLYKCSPKVTRHTMAVLTIKSFDKGGGSGGGPSKCDFQFHSDDTTVVALSTGWFNNMRRCLHYINIYGNGKSVKAKVIDECNSAVGCDMEHDFQPPCDNNIVAASRAVWQALGVPDDEWDELDIFWSDA